MYKFKTECDFLNDVDSRHVTKSVYIIWCQIDDKYGAKLDDKTWHIGDKNKQDYVMYFDRKLAGKIR